MHRKRNKKRMTRPGITGERMLSLFFLGLLLFNPPLLNAFDAGADVTVVGIPLLYIYIFVAWGVLIVLLAVTIDKSVRITSADKGRKE